MKTRRVWLLLALVALPLLALAKANTAAPSPIVYPPQRIPLAFTHGAHAARGVACTSCHAATAHSDRAAEDSLPGEDACTACHTIDRAHPSADCGSCHVGHTGSGLPAPLVAPPANLKFSHKLHAERGVPCARCHGDLAREGAGIATRLDLPREATCLSCHEGKRCVTCHIAGPGGLVRTDFPEGRLAPTSDAHGGTHDLDWASQA